VGYRLAPGQGRSVGLRSPRGQNRLRNRRGPAQTLRFWAQRGRSLAGLPGVLTRPVRAVDHELGVLEHAFDAPHLGKQFLHVAFHCCACLGVKRFAPFGSTRTPKWPAWVLPSRGRRIVLNGNAVIVKATPLGGRPQAEP